MPLPEAPKSTFQTANRQFGAVLLVGVALGIANFALGVYPTLGQSIVLQVVISILIGYPLLVLAALFFDTDRDDYKSISLLIVGYFMLGVLATEGQQLADYLLFDNPNYRLGGAGGIYLFNGILTAILGWMTLRWWRASGVRVLEEKPQEEATQEASAPEAQAPLTKLPIRRGEKTVLVDLDDILYFEAYDNYAFAHHQDGNRHLSNYSLSTLTERLSGSFLRVHRKYLVNVQQIESITPHLKGRYVLVLGTVNQQSVRTGASYAEAVRELTKL